MATQDTSPSLLIGQQWSAWNELFAPVNHTDDALCSKEKAHSDSMKLGKKDMGLFGYCPSRDDFMLVVCEKCNLLIKPQALKQHIESRHGPTNLGSLGSVPPSALNSELGKKLLMPEPFKTQLHTNTSISKISSRSPASTALSQTSIDGRPPTKASLKQIPVSLQHGEATPKLGVSMKISPVKTIKPGNRVSPASNTTAKTKILSSTPVVKMEKLPENIPSTTVTTSITLVLSSSTLSTSSVSAGGKPMTLMPTSSKPESSRISTLVNGSLKTAVSLTTPSSMSFSSLLNISALTPPSHVVTTKSSMITPVSSHSLSSAKGTMPVLTKPIMISPVMTASSSSPVVSQSHQKSFTAVSSGTKSSKLPKEQKKFLPCKDREYDPNKHCGVKSENGKSCTRSLTCKTHALSLRRAVQGRCKSFDDLLKEHKAAKDALIKAKSESQKETASSIANRVSVASPGGQVKNASLKQSSAEKLRETKITSPGVRLTPSLLSRGYSTSSLILSCGQNQEIIKPSNIFQRFAPAAVTIKEEAPLYKSAASVKQAVSASSDIHTTDGRDPSYLPHHPRPFAVCHFGGRLNDRSCCLFSRKTDLIRAAALSSLERQLNPPPAKKLCIESKLPKDGQLASHSQDPYEFDLMETSCSATGSSVTVGNDGKAPSKSRSKVASSSIVSLSSTLIPLSSSTPSNSVILSSSACLSSSGGSSVTSLPMSLPLSCPSPSIYPVVSFNQQPVSKPASRTAARNRESAGSARNVDGVASGAAIPGKRKRNSSSGCHTLGVNNNILVAAGSLNGPISGNTAIISNSSSAGLTLNSVGELSQPQLDFKGLISQSTLTNNHTRNLIAIPSVNLNQLGAASGKIGSVGTAAVVSGGACGAGSIPKNNVYKDINLVLTGIDSSSLVNGQYVNITSAQLAELAGSQGQTLVLNNFPNNVNNNAQGVLAAAPLSVPTLAGGGSLPSVASGIVTSGSPKVTKRNRPAGNARAHRPAVISEDTATASKAASAAAGHPLEGFKFIPSNNVIASTSAIPSNTVLMDGSSLQGATMLTSVALAPTLVAISSSTASGNSRNNLLNNPPQLLHGVRFTNIL